MAKGIWLILLIVVVIVVAMWASNNMTKNSGMNSGEVTRRVQTGDSAVPETAPPVQTQQTQQVGAPVATPDGTTAGTPNVAPYGTAVPPDGYVIPPATDTIPRDPPNGERFVGRGKYQLYRQGDITWRLNTETGQTCIVFATDAEWRKPKVFAQGCGER